MEDTSVSRKKERCYRGRCAVMGQRVFVYRNLNQDCWSVRAAVGADYGRVLCHSDSVALYDAEFVVNESGRQRVLREQKKNVHAGVVGLLAPDHDWVHSGKFLCTTVRYNPYRCGCFTTESSLPVLRASHVHLGTDGVVRAGGVLEGKGN